MTRHRRAAFATSFLICALFALPAAAQDSRVRVIVELKLASGPHVPEGQGASAAAIAAQRRAIADTGARVLARLQRGGPLVLHRYETVPYLALEMSAGEARALANAAQDVVRVMEDSIARPVLAQSVPLVEGDQAWASGYDGSGTTIAVIDTGVDALHPFLSGKVLEEACYSSTVAGASQSFCPNGLNVQLGPGSAVPCSLSDCIHGTHVAGIAAGSGASFSGVARGARLMAVQVFSKILSPLSCGGIAPCAGAYASDIIAGLERVYLVAPSRQIVAVNMSLGGDAFSAPCDDQPYKPIIDNLRSIGVATVVASGNNGSTSNLSSPACISSAISVGSTEKNDTVSWFSNVASFMSLFAPGGSIVSSVPGGGYQALSGTSMAAPHVAGAWAVVRQASPGASVTAVLTALRQTGLPIADTRFGGTQTVPRIRIFRALAEFVAITNPMPAVTSVSPARVRAGTAVTFTVTGTGFDGFSVLQWNGAARPTTVVSTTQLRAVVSAADLAVAGTALVSVFTPAPGGGTSASLPVVIDPPPTLTISATSVAPGALVTVTLTNGLGGSTDWLALAAAGAPDTSYLKWTYVGAGLTTKTWTVTMPSMAGPYEFRLFLNNGSTRAATSPAVTVTAPLNPPTLSVSATSATPGSSVTVTLTNGFGGASDWLAFAATSAPDTSYLNYIYIGAGVTTRTWTVTMPSTPGTYEFRLYPNNGSTRAATSPTVTVAGSPTPPVLSVSATSVAPGASVTVTLTNGYGGATDWLAFASTSAPDTSYLKYVYIGAGVTTRTWTVTAPTTPGTYEFRLYPNNGYTRAATSPTVTVTGGLNP